MRPIRWACAATPVHPTEIYESLLNLALYLGLAWLFRRKKFDGQVFGAYLVCYAVLRSFVESSGAITRCITWAAGQPRHSLSAWVSWPPAWRCSGSCPAQRWPPPGRASDREGERARVAARPCVCPELYRYPNHRVG